MLHVEAHGPNLSSDRLQQDEICAIRKGSWMHKVRKEAVKVAQGSQRFQRVAGPKYFHKERSKQVFGEKRGKRRKLIYLHLVQSREGSLLTHSSSKREAPGFFFSSISQARDKEGLA